MAVAAVALLAAAWPAFGGAQNGATAPAASRADLVASLAGGPWRIVEVAGRRAQPDTRITFANGTISGSAGCNRFFAPLSAGASLGVGTIQTTLMTCAGRMDGERAVLAALSRIRTAARLGADGLELRDATGTALLRLTR